MSADSNQGSEDQFLCSICLDVFTDPVSTPCGHNFCKTCIIEHWYVNDRHQCPVCKQLFNPKPKLEVNTLIAELADEFRKSTRGASPQQQAAQPQTVPPQQQAAQPQTVPPDLNTEASRKSLIFWACVFVFFAFMMQNFLLKEEKQQKIVEIIKKEVPKLLARAELQRVQVYAVEVTLDPDTAHPNLILSDDGKQVHHCDVKKNLPYNPERFSIYANVLGKQSFTSGRFYFEVQVKGKTTWVLGVAKESINRKELDMLTPEYGYWTIWLRDDKYKARENYMVDLPLQSPLEKVGVFVDYEDGLVSFYDVDSASLIYSFTRCSFTERIYPFLSPEPHENGRNSAPLIITSVKH